MSTYIDDSWTVGANEAGVALAQELMFDSHHVLLGDALSDAHHQGDLGINGLNNGSCRKRRGHINHSGVCPRAILCLRRGIKCLVFLKSGALKREIPKL